MLLNCLNWLCTTEHVTIEIKAVCVGDCVEVSGEKKKQYLVVADATGRCRVTIWEQDFGKVEEDECYCMQLESFVERSSYQHQRKKVIIIKKIDDIGSVEENQF